MVCTFNIVLMSFFLMKTVVGSDLNNTVFIVMSQPNQHHVKISEETERKLIENLKREGIEEPKVLLLHRDLNFLGNWAVLPILPTLNKIGGIYGQAVWFAFVPEAAEINVNVLKTVLLKYSPKR